MNKIFATGLLSALSILPMGFSMEHEGAKDAEMYLRSGRGPEFALKMYSILLMRDLCKEAQKIEQSTGIYLGSRNGDGSRNPMANFVYMVDPARLSGKCQQGGNIADDIYNFSITFVTLVSALRELDSEVNFGYDAPGNHFINISAKIKSTEKGGGLRAFRDFLRSKNVNLDDFTKVTDATLQSLRNASNIVAQSIYDSIYNQEKFRYDAQNDLYMDAQLG